MFLDVIERVNDQGCGGLEIERANVVQSLKGGFCLQNDWLDSISCKYDK
jgi:hypothetical protein